MTNKRERTDVGAITKRLTKTFSGYGFVFIFLGIFISYLIINLGATSLGGIMNILRHSAVVGIIAFGMGLVIITGGIDLSVGSIMALSGGLGVVAFNQSGSIAVLFAVTVITGLLAGLLNGVLAGIVKMPAFIVTLSTMLIYRSISQYYLRSMGLSIYNMDARLPSYERFYSFGQGKILSFPTVGLIFIAIAIVFSFLTTSTKFGKSVFAMGSNEKAARLAGVNVDLIRVLVFVITGGLCGVSAFLWLGMNGSVDPATFGRSNEMYAIAAVVIGGVSMSGGKGKLIGIAFGAMSYTVIDKIIASLGLDALINDAIKGAILLTAVMIQIVIPGIRRKRVRAKIV